MARMGNHCLVRLWCADFPNDMEIRLRHVEVNDHQHAPTATIWRDAQNQCALSMQCVRSGTSRGDGTRRRPTTAEALSRRHGHHRPALRIVQGFPQNVDNSVGNDRVVIRDIARGTRGFPWVSDIWWLCITRQEARTNRQPSTNYCGHQGQIRGNKRR